MNPPPRNFDLHRLRTQHRLMWRIRALEQAALRGLAEKQVLGAIHPSIDQEAVAAGVVGALRRDDILLSTHRGHGHTLAKGANSEAMLRELLGRVGGTCGGKGGSMHIADFSVGMLGANGVVGANIVIAAGAAHAIKLKREDRIVCCIFGDGAINRGPFLEGLNWAAVFGLPVLFVCEDNGFAATTRTASMTAGAMAAAVALIARAERPILLAGGGVHLSGAANVLTDFARALNLPVAHTMTGKGAIPCTDPLSAGLFGSYDRIANAFIAESDLIIVAGCKLGEIATKRFTVPPAGKTILHIDIVAEEFGRTAEPELCLWGDVRDTIAELHALLTPQEAAIAARQADHAAAVARKMAEWRADVQPRLTSDETPVSMARLMHELNRIMPADAVLVADDGFAAHWSGLLYDTKVPGRGFVPDRGFASIGYGLPGAMGAALGASGRKVVSITGDGGFNMMLGELETARRLNLAFTIVVINNAASGYVKALQHLMYGPGSYHASDLAETNYARIAEAMGVRGIRVEQPGALAAALAAGLAGDGPTVIDLVVTRDPAKMLPAVDNRAVQIKKGDRVA